MKIILSALLIAASFTALAQVGIGTTAPQAALDVSSTTQGFLPPRMTTAQRDAIVSPVSGLTIYNLDQEILNVFTGSYFEGFLPMSSWISSKTSNSVNLGSTAVRGTVFNTRTAFYNFRTIINAYLSDALSAGDYNYIMDNRSQFKIEIGLGDRRSSNISRFEWFTLLDTEETQSFNNIGSQEYYFRITLSGVNITATCAHGGLSNTYGGIRGIKITKL
jgi:hypothetical protein